MLARHAFNQPHPIDERALKDQAHALLQRGQLKPALAIFSRLITLSPDDAGLRLQHAQLCKRLDQPIQAVNSWWTAANLLHRAGHDGRARAALACALELAPHDLNLRNALKSWREKTSPRLSLVSSSVEPGNPAPLTTGFDEVGDELLGFHEQATDPFIPVFDAPRPPIPIGRKTVGARPGLLGSR